MNCYKNLPALIRLSLEDFRKTMPDNCTVDEYRLHDWYRDLLISDIKLALSNDIIKESQMKYLIDRYELY